MASLISSGIGSGIDIDGLVTQLVAAQGSARGARLAAREAGFQAKLSAFGSFRSALDSLQSALAPLKDVTQFQGRSVTVGDNTVLTVTASATAAPSSYDVEVERLATSHRLVSAAYATSNTAVGTGTLHIAIGEQSFDIVIGEEANALGDIRNAINSASNNTGVVASIVNETGVGSRLILSSTLTGADNTIELTQTPGDGGLQALIAGLTEGQAAQDSRIVINGFAHESASNSVTTAVDGLTFNLLAPSEEDVTTPVGIVYNKDAARQSVNTFVTAYNSLVSSLRGLNSFNAASGTGGPLLGDSTLRDFMYAVRRELGVQVSGVSDSFSTLAEIGIVSNVDGTLEVNAARLDGFIATDFDQVGGLFANEAGERAPVDGLARRLDALIETYTGSNGLLEARTAGLKSSIDVIDEQREVLEQRLTTLEARLRAQFTAMDSLVAQLNNTSNFLTQQINTLNGSAILAQQRGR